MNKAKLDKGYALYKRLEELKMHLINIETYTHDHPDYELQISRSSIVLNKANGQEDFIRAYVQDLKQEIEKLQKEFDEL